MGGHAHRTPKQTKGSDVCNRDGLASEGVV